MQMCPFCDKEYDEMDLNDRIIDYLKKHISRTPFFSMVPLQNGYRVEKMQPVDMFPHTNHVETVCLLCHQKKNFISTPHEPKAVVYQNH